MHRREKSFKNITFIFFVIFTIWIFLQFLAPLSVQKGSVRDLSGTVLFFDNKDKFNDMPIFISNVYFAGDILCHQKPERSFFINENQMPFCSRCTAIWLGFAIGLGFMVFYFIELNEKFLFLLILSIIPIGIDGVGQLFGYWESSNIIRLITGLLVGIFCGVALGVIFDEVNRIA